MRMTFFIINVSDMCRWVKEFCEDGTEIKDTSRSCCPSTSSTENTLMSSYGKTCGTPHDEIVIAAFEVLIA